MSSKRLVAILTLLLALALMPPCAQAETAEASGGDKENLDVVLLLDSSGSMLLTDPLRLRDEGAKLFVQLLRSSDRLAIVEFSETPKLLRPLTAFDAADAQSISNMVAGIVSQGKYTNLLAPLKMGVELLEQHGREDSSQAVILLSDGKMDPNPSDGTPEAVTNEMLENFLPQVKSRGVKIHTLSLSEEADKELLSQIAVRSNGSHWYTPTADKIHQSFAELFVVVKKPQMLPLTNKGFRIDAEIQEATFYINRDGDGEVALVSPNGEKTTARTAGGHIKWYHGAKFDVVTIEDPQAGQWQVEGLPSNDGFVAVLTNLKLQTDWAGTMTSGMPALLEARLYESKKPVVLPQMTGVVSYRFKVTPTDRVSEPIIREFLVDDGTHGDKIAGDGVFSARVTIDEPGEYKLGLVASGPTFERFQELFFRVKPRLISLEVQGPEQALLARGGGERAAEYFHVSLSTEVQGLKKMEVKLAAIDKEKRRLALPLTRIDDVYEAPVSILPEEGQYELTASVSGVGRGGKRVQGDSKTLQYLKLPEAKRETAVVVHEAPKEAPRDPRLLQFLISAVLMTLLNGAAASLAMKMLQKGHAVVSGDLVTERFLPIEPIITTMMALEERAQATDVDLNAPMFAEVAGTKSGTSTKAHPREERQAPQKEEEPPAEEEMLEEADQVSDDIPE